MAHPERNAALSGLARFEPAQSGMLAWPNQSWFQWSVTAVGLAVPAAVVLVSSEYLDDARIVATLVTGALIVFNAFLGYRAIRIFDDEAVRSLRYAGGLGMKLLAVLYACGAMFLLAHSREDGWTLQNRWLFSSPLLVPEWFVWGFFAFCWFMSAVCYLVGDAHVRVSQDDEYYG